VTELEEKYAESERERQKTEGKVASLKKGDALPGSPRDMKEKLEQLDDTLSDLLEARAYQRVASMLDMIKTHVETVEELKQFGIEIDALSDVLKGIESVVTSVNHKLQVLTNQFSADFEDRHKLRQQQRQTLGLLNQYLKDWV